MDPIRISRSLTRAVASLDFAVPVTHVYNPLDYARSCHEAYLRRYARPGCEALLLGMNPGPFGMAQTGVPFGEIEHVRDWLAIDGTVTRPEHEHPKRPVLGFDCPRSEVSGRRLWSWARKRFETPERFFQRFFVWNYCPLAFLEESGRNRTPDKLPTAERAPLFEACDQALRRMVEHLGPRLVIGVGAFAARQAGAALGVSPRPTGRPRSTGTAPLPIEIGTVLHPSPASPAANRGWEPQAEAQLAALGIRL